VCAKGRAALGSERKADKSSGNFDARQVRR